MVNAIYITPRRPRPLEATRLMGDGGRQRWRHGNPDEVARMTSRMKGSAMVRILVPTNFSDTSQAVIRYLLPWIDAVRDELLLLHVVPEILSRWSDAMDTMFIEPALHDDVYRDLCEQAHWRLSNLLPPAWKGQSRTVVVVGKPAEEIVRVAREEQVDLIVMGTPKKSLWRRMLSGSVVARVIRGTHIPVISVANLEWPNFPPSLDNRAELRRLMPNAGHRRSRSLGRTTQPP
jgi:nucleotide-binding universal stress UspA family protein